MTAKKKAPKKKAARKRTPKSPPVDLGWDTGPIEPPPQQNFSQEFLDNKFKPGQSGNPGGRPKGRRSIKSWVNKVLQEEVETTEGLKMTKAEALARRLVNGALRSEPDRQLLQILTSREYPKPNIHDIRMGNAPNDTVHEAVGELDDEGRAALELALDQLGAKSQLSDEPASEDDPVH